MRFFRLFVIPEGFQTKQGAYVRDYSQDLLGILALESARGNFVVIGEDLGTVTDEGRDGLADNGILSYRLLWFERDGAGNFLPPAEYPARALASTTTHDLPTLAGFKAGRDLDARKHAGLADEEEYQKQKAYRAEEVGKLERAMADAGYASDPLGFLLATPCLLVALNQEDLTGETNQQNLPGSTWQYPNWRRKMQVPVEECGSLAAQFAEVVRRSGRAPYMK
jgi:4-alpha-glucanotransferase